MDFTKYSFAFENGRNPPWAMDRRHVALLHRLAMAVPRGGRCVEIGCHRGASTCAFVEALKSGCKFRLELVDPQLTPQLDTLIGMCPEGAEDVFYHKMRSIDYLHPKGVDLIFIDGDHGEGALVDVYRALDAGAVVIAMHDTRSHEHGIPGCYGAWLAARLLRNLPERRWSEDCEARPGEWTHRGFGWSWLAGMPMGDLKFGIGDSKG